MSNDVSVSGVCLWWDPKLRLKIGNIILAECGLRFLATGAPPGKNIGGICIHTKLSFLGIIATRSMPYTPQHLIARPWKQVDSQLD